MKVNGGFQRLKEKNRLGRLPTEQTCKTSETIEVKKLPPSKSKVHVIPKIKSHKWRFDDNQKAPQHDEKK